MISGSPGIKRFLTLLFTDRDIDDIAQEKKRDTHEKREIDAEIIQIIPQDMPVKEEIRTFVTQEKHPKIDPNILNPKKIEKTVWSDAIILWVTPDQNEVIVVEQESLKRHMLIIGMTGSGKTTMLERMVLQEIDSWNGVGLIDPHGDLYEKVLQQIPKSRSNDVVLFDLTDIEYPIGFNILENTHHQFPSLIASSIVAVFKKIFGYSWWPRLEYILRNATLTLLERDGSTLLDLALLLSDNEFRNSYIAKIHNPFLQRFWTDEFNALSSTKQTEVVSPILNKVGQFLSVPLIRNIVSQPQSWFSPRWIMDNKKIFLANLSKGKIGEDVSDMLGSLLVSKFQLDAMSRASIDPNKREQFSLYVDEFQNFATESFAGILSEARKYGLNLIMAHQYIGQVSPELMDSIMGNVGNISVFHIGSWDAKILAPNLSPSITPQLLTEQPLYNFVLKTSKNGKKILQNWELIHPDFIGQRVGSQDAKKLQTLVHEKFAKERSFVEEKLQDKIS